MALELDDDDASFFSAALALLDDLPPLPPPKRSDEAEASVDAVAVDTSTAAEDGALLGNAHDLSALLQEAPVSDADMTVANDRAYDAATAEPARRLIPLLPRPGGEPVSTVVIPPKRVKRPGYNPNKARDERKQELEYLRAKVQQMQQELAILKDHAVAVKRPFSSIDAPQPRPLLLQGPLESGDQMTPKVWEAMARGQLRRRLKAESENLRLRHMLEGQVKIALSMERLLHKPAPQFLTDEFARVQRIKMSYSISSTSMSDSAIFQELMADAETTYKEVDAVFQSIGLYDLEQSYRDVHVRDGPDCMYLDVYGNKVLPFNMRSTAAAVWNHYRGGDKHQGSIYSKSAQSLEPSEDTIVEKFTLEHFANNMWADFEVWQVVRRFVEADRVVVVWVSHAEPVEVAHKRLSGIGFQEKGYVVCKRPQQAAASDPDGFSLLQICYRIVPYVTKARAKQAEKDRPSNLGVLTDFVISMAGKNISAHQEIIENVLIDQAIQSQKQTTQ